MSLWGIHSDPPPPVAPEASPAVVKTPERRNRNKDTEPVPVSFCAGLVPVSPRTEARRTKSPPIGLLSSCVPAHLTDLGDDEEEEKEEPEMPIDSETSTEMAHSSSTGQQQQEQEGGEMNFSCHSLMTDVDYHVPPALKERPKAKAEASIAKSSWRMNVPRDITWPDPTEPGAFPPDDFRNKRFKLIPVITEGPWVVQAAVRSKPALLGQKVVQRYFRGDNYLETDVHVGSSVIASQIVGLCRGYAKNFVCDVAVVLQGEDTAELPERVLASITLNRIDVDIRRKL